ncbi:ribosomal RNA processing protein 36-like [Silurus asotus]|uniref:rRNA biogenesis protein RRP36 n=1 Tax=Silurus asotus TaxID=30991 RepID=A0AAD5FM25_SILAS|nr:ribosomal RNA processing protein 36-like [Silurus asotus]
MASKKKQKSLKKNPQFASPVQAKRLNQASFTDDMEDEDALEMERNFALVNKSGLAEKSEMSEKAMEETSGEESNQADEADGSDEEANDFEEEHGQTETTDVTGSEDSDNEKPNDPDPRIHTVTGLKQDLSTMSFEEILKLQSKVGRKACNKLLCNTKQKKKKLQPLKQASKDRPQEISSKRPVSLLRKEGFHKKPSLRDPRFDDLSGDFRPEVFSQTYKFIEEIRHGEAEENQKRNHQQQEQQREKELHFKRKQRALVEGGHRPFYLKKSDQKKLQLAEKYNELKKSGKLENFLSKKRKRNAVKDRRKLP